MPRIAYTLLIAAFAVISPAQEPPAPTTPKPISIAFTALGDSDAGVVVRVSFTFPTPPEVPPETGLILQGSLIQDGQVLRNFRYNVPPEQRGEVRTIQTFKEGEAEVVVRLVMPLDDEAAPVLLARTGETFKVAKTNKVYVADVDDGAEAILAEGVIPEIIGAVRIRPPRRDVAPNLFIVTVDVMPPVKRVEFWVEGKKIIARNAPPYRAELDLGKLPKRVEVRAIGYDAAGRYVDADAFVVNERDSQLETKLTRTQTPDGVSHFKLSIQNPKGTVIKSVVFYVGDQKFHEWKRPPYALDIANTRLTGQQFVRASVIDDTGYEAADLMFLDGDRYIEQIEVNLIELPISVTDAGGLPITDLAQKNFSVFENGKGMTISSFNFAANLPISVGVLLDHSGSMQPRMKDAKEAAVEFFKSIIKKNDKAFIGAFAGDPTRNAPFVSDVSSLEAQVNAIPDAAGGTSLYDAIITGLYRFRNIQGRKALIVITDGEDTTSRLSYDDMLVYARASRVPFYFIGVGMGGFGELGGSGKMKSLAAETGGVAYFIRSSKDLGATYKQLEQELRTQYLLSYHAESTKKDTAYRTVEVKVDRPNAKVRTIRGYIP